MRHLQFRPVIPVFVAAAAVLGTAALTARADDPASGEITYSGQLLMRIRTPSGGYTAEQRAEHIRHRLVPILSIPNLTADDITIDQPHPMGDATISVRGHLLVTIDPVMSRANGDTDPAAMARVWADHLKQILPSVSVKPNPEVERSESNQVAVPATGTGSSAP